MPSATPSKLPSEPKSGHGITKRRNGAETSGSPLADSALPGRKSFPKLITGAPAKKTFHETLRFSSRIAGGGTSA